MKAKFPLTILHLYSLLDYIYYTHRTTNNYQSVSDQVATESNAHGVFFQSFDPLVTKVIYV